MSQHRGDAGTSSMTNIRKVAETAGVSTATVSRAFAHPEQVSEATLDKVMKAAKKANYRPNLLARSFRSARAYSIVVLVPNIANPFFSRVIRGIEEVAQENGYAVLLGDTRDERAREAEYVELVRTRRADGIIQLSHELPDGADVPLVNACECKCPGQVPSVRIDNRRAAATICNYLVSIGHRRIGVVRGPAASPLTRERLKGYRDALAGGGIGYDKTLVHDGNFSLAAGLKSAQTFARLGERPTAVFCMNDEMAIGLVHGLRNLGIEVPAQISVAGFDDIEFARFASPPLTTIAQPAEEIGRTAMSVLYGLLQGIEPERNDYVLATEFVVRNSTAPPRIPAGR
jgi:LacI family repressor for deo operon, udp, cdd, tsx, nupC, and nupG